MAKVFPLFFTILILALVSTTYASAVKCGSADWRAAKERMKAMIYWRSGFKDGGDVWPGRLLRAGFHDCFPGSCDGSLQFELDRLENVNVDATVNFLKQVKGDSCVSMGDIIKIGVMLSLELTDAPRVSCPLGNRKDATKANPPFQIPAPFANASTIFNVFKSKGFTELETLGGNFGGHEIGVANSTHQVPFTSTLDKYDGSFTKFIVGLPKTKILADFADFNAVESDLTLADDNRGTMGRFAKNRQALDQNFAAFMKKLCRM